MCDFSGKLIAWLDHELPVDEAAAVERHVESCSKCRNNVEAYKRVSTAFEAYCDESVAANVRREASRWLPVVSAAGVAAAALALFLAWPRTPAHLPEFRPPQAAMSASSDPGAIVLPARVRPIQRVRHRRVVAPTPIQNAIVATVQDQNVYILPDEPVIQIAIPADEIFPPGAVPEGVHFAADLTIAADGSAERLRVRPRLAGFERRTTQP